VSDLSGAGDPASKSDWGWGGSEPAIQALAGEALLAARSGGAEYADVRVVELEEERIYAVTGREVDWRSEHSYGVGVRVLRHGAWGFGSRALGDAEAGVNAAGAALLMAGNDDTAGGASLPPQPGHRGRYATPMIIDPFTVPAAEKEAILADMLATASSAPQVIRAVAGLNAKRQRRYFASTEDAWQVQELMECGGVYQVWARSGDEVQRRSYPDSFHGNTGAAGWEYVKSLHLGDEAHRVVDEACALLRAPTSDQWT
jgi:TldD protein